MNGDVAMKIIDPVHVWVVVMDPGRRLSLHASGLQAHDNGPGSIWRGMIDTGVSGAEL